jgi:hypothetical protein
MKKFINRFLNPTEPKRETPVKFEKRYELSHDIDTYSAVEYVAIPENFELENHLTFRERMGLQKNKNINMKNIKAMAMAVRSGPTFTMMNSQFISIHDCVYFLYILDQLDCIVRSIPNPFRFYNDTYERWIDDSIRLDSNTEIFIDGHFVRNINLIIINIYNLMNDETFEDVIQTATDLEEYQKNLKI